MPQSTNPPWTDPFDPRRPFARRAALDAGLTPDELRGPRFRPLLRGVAISADVAPDPIHSAFYDSHPPASVRIRHLRLAGVA